MLSWTTIAALIRCTTLVPMWHSRAVFEHLKKRLAGWRGSINSLPIEVEVDTGALQLTQKPDAAGCQPLGPVGRQRMSRVTIGESLGGRTFMPADLMSELLPIADHEGFLLRLFRCVTAGEQSGVLATVLQTLAMRFCLDPASRPFEPSALKFELGMDLDERLRRACPLSWPGQNLVELDTTGDAGFWLDSVLGYSTVEWFCDLSSDHENAAELAREYMSTIREQGYPLPSDFSDSPVGQEDGTDEDEVAAQAEFLGFFSYWRHLVISTIAAQSLPSASVQK